MFKIKKLKDTHYYNVTGADQNYKVITKNLETFKEIKMFFYLNH